MEKVDTKFEQIANSIDGLVSSVNYGYYTNDTLEVILMLVNYIRIVPPDEISGFRLVKDSLSHSIFKNLKQGFIDQNLMEAVKEQLMRFERWEVLYEMNR